MALPTANFNILSDGGIQFQKSQPISNVPSSRGDGIFGVVKTSLEYYGMSRLSHKKSNNKSLLGVPDVWRINPEILTMPNGKPKKDFVSMTYDIQHWIFRMQVERHLKKKFNSEEEYINFYLSLPGVHTLKSWFASMFTDDRSHTNFAGSLTCANYIGDPRSGLEPMKFSNLITGGAVIKLLSTETRTLRGVKCLPFQCINISKGDYRNYDVERNFYLFDEPSISIRKLILDSKGGWTGKFLEDLPPQPYPQFPPLHPIFPIMLPYDDIAWIDANWVKILLPTDPTPYKFAS